MKRLKPSDAVPLHIHVERWRRYRRVIKNPLSAVLAMEIIGVLHDGHLVPFVFDPDEIAAGLAAVFPQSMLADEIAGCREDLLLYFDVLPDGRWVPSPKMFSATAGHD